MNKVISVYFSGTGFSIDETILLAARLYEKTEESDSHIKMGFNGCGVDYGLTGTIFGSGLDEQCHQVITRVVQEINAGHQITLNVYGHSRGGVAALLLAKQLNHMNAEKLAINLALLDPVPGNFITTASIDPFNISLANKTMDLSDCKPLKKVLALYPYKPLPAIACHAPLLVSYPKDTEVDEEVITGCHAQAEYLNHPASQLAMCRVEAFLVKNGTKFHGARDYDNAKAMTRIYLRLYKEALDTVEEATWREAHSAQDRIITAETGATYLNSHHKALAGDNSSASVALSIQPAAGFFASIKAFLADYTGVTQAIKWIAMSLSMASLLYATGGLVAIPFLAPLVAKIGALSLMVVSPVIGGTLAALWYGAAKPVLTWCAEKFFYPYFSLPTLDAPVVVKGEDSPQKLIGLLGVEPSIANQLDNAPDVAPYQGPSPLSAAKEMLNEQDACYKAAYSPSPSN